MKKIAFLGLILTLVIIFWPADQAQAYQPEPRITFTFDDGAKRIYANGMPVLANYNIPAVLYGETGPLNSGEDWVMTWDQVRDLRDSYGWEIGSHTITHPYLTQVSDEQLTQELLGAKQDFAAEGIEVKTFSTPYGDYDDRVLTEIAKYYESHRAAWGGPNIWPWYYNDYQIVCEEAHHTTPPEEVQTWVDQAIANNQWLVLLFHDVVEGEPEAYQYNVNDLEQIAAYVASQPIEVVTISEALNFSDEPNLISNFTFSNLDGNGWAQNWLRNDETNVVIDTNNHGNISGLANSLKIIGGADVRSAQTELIEIDGFSEYLLRMYQNVQDLTAGGWAVWLDEFASDYSYVGGQWLDGNYYNFIGDRYYEYLPTSPAVTKIQIHIFTEENSDLTLYVDSVELRAVGIANPNPNLISNSSFENLTEGWADDWTREDANITIDINNNGYGESPQNSLKIVAGDNQRIAISSMIAIDGSQDYQLSFYQKIIDFVPDGGSAVWIDEFDSNDSWISGAWLGGTYWWWDGIRAFDYNPNSPEVSKIQIHIFTEAGSELTMYVDAMELRVK